MTLARPLADDPVLLGRQREIAALKVVGSGVDASADRHRQDDHDRPRARPPRRHDAAAARHGRRRGPAARRSGATSSRAARPAAGCRRWRPNVEVLVLDDRRSVAGQLRAFDRALGDRPGVALVANGAARPPPGGAADASAGTCWSPTRRCATPTPPPRPTRRSRRSASSAAADCWLLTATPRGKSAEHLDVLVGLARRRRGDDPRAAQHARGRRPDRRDQRPPPARQLRPAPRARHPPGHAAPGCRRSAPPSRSRSTPDPALAELLDAIRHGGREAYRRLLEVLRELKTLEPGSALLQAGAGRARARPGRRARQRRRLRRRLRRPRDAHALQGRARAGARPPRPRGARRCAAAATGCRCCAAITAQTIAGVAGEEQVIVFAERVRCLRQLAAHAARAPRRRGARRRRLAHRAPSSRRSSSASAPASSRSCACRQVGHEGHNLQNASCSVAPRPAVAADRARAARRTRRPARRRARLGADLHPLHQGAGIEHVVSCSPPAAPSTTRSSTASRASPPPTPRSPPSSAQITGQVADRQARRRLRRHRRAPARRRRRLRRLNPTKENLTMSAIDAALGAIDRVARRGRPRPRPPSAPLELEAAADPILLPDGRRIYPPLLHGEPVDELACALLDMDDPAQSTFLRLTGPPGSRQEPDRAGDRLPAVDRPRPPGRASATGRRSTGSSRSPAARPATSTCSGTSSCPPPTTPARSGSSTRRSCRRCARAGS